MAKTLTISLFTTPYTRFLAKNPSDYSYLIDLMMERYDKVIGAF